MERDFEVTYEDLKEKLEEVEEYKRIIGQQEIVQINNILEKLANVGIKIYDSENPTFRLTEVIYDEYGQKFYFEAVEGKEE